MAIYNKVQATIATLNRYSFFHLLSSRFLIQFMGFGSTILVAKLLNATELGHVRSFQSYAAILTVLCSLGLNSLILKACSESRPYPEKEGFLTTSLAICLTVSILVIAGSYVIISNTSFHPEAGLNLWLFIFLLSIPFTVTTDLLSNFLQALKRFKDVASAQSLIKVQSILVILVSTWKFGFPGFVVATSASYAIGLIPLLRKASLSNWLPKWGSLDRRLCSIAIISLAANLFGILSQHMDILLINQLVSDRTEVGYYSLATIFLLAAMQVTGTVQAITTPIFSENATNTAWLKSKLVSHQVKLALLSVGVAIATYIGASFLVHLFYGQAYLPVLTYLPILLLKYVIWSSYTIIGVVLFGVGLIKYNLLSSLVLSFSSLVLSYILIQSFGLTGVAFAQVIAAALVLTINIAIVSTILKKKQTG